MSGTCFLNLRRFSWTPLCLALAVASCSGCGSSAVSDAATLDQQIEEKWMANREVVDAIPFFEGGGLFENLGDAGEVPVDTTYVLPLLKRVRDELALKPVAILEGPQRALAILVELPSSPAQRKRLGGILQEADQAYPGLLMDHWGDKWLSLDFLDEGETKAFESSGVLELMQKEHEFQRRQEG